MDLLSEVAIHILQQGELKDDSGLHTLTNIEVIDDRHIKAKLQHYPISYWRVWRGNRKEGGAHITIGKYTLGCVKTVGTIGEVSVSNNVMGEVPYGHEPR